MLKRIHLKSFKASEDVDVRLNALTVLTGLNGSGKSTLLQAIALLRQSYNNSNKSSGLVLGGHLVQLGKGADVLSESSEDENISITLFENETEYCWVCKSETDQRLLKYSKSPDSLPSFIQSADFQFIQANRMVPNTIYPQSSSNTDDFKFLGIGGEYTADFLSIKGRAIEVSEARRCDRSGLQIDDSLMDKAAPTHNLVDQVSGWLQQLSPGARISVDRIPGTNEVSLQYNYIGRSRESESGQTYRPANVGFGLTYTLPIITACLSAPSGSLLLLENPEAHLHPQGQAALGELLAKCAGDGVQIIVETHSDHLLNGIRVSAKNSLIEKENVVFHFFTRETETGEVVVQSPALLDQGRLSNWPEGFFDQWDKSIDELLN
jgi:predicted ATPase